MSTNSMQIALSLHERFLLEAWLARASKPGEPQTDTRSLVAAEQTLDPSEVQDHLHELRKCLALLQTSRSMLEVRPPLGRGFTARQPGDTVLSWLSPWEEAWLVVDRIRSAGGLDRPAVFGELTGALRTSLVNAVAVAILCGESAAEAEQIAHAATLTETTPRDRAWLRWLAGERSVELADNLTGDLVGETPKQALRAALAGQWSQVLQLLPKTLKKPFPNSIQASGTRMQGQFLAQLAQHALRGEPRSEVIAASLTTLFGFFGFSKESAWWDGREVVTRLPLLALYAREFEPDRAAAVLLHAQRQANPHLVEPPQRSFVAPREVVRAVEKLENILARAAANAGSLTIALTEAGNVYSMDAATPKAE